MKGGTKMEGNMDTVTKKRHTIIDCYYYNNYIGKTYCFVLFLTFLSHSSLSNIRQVFLLNWKNLRWRMERRQEEWIW